MNTVQSIIWFLLKNKDKGTFVEDILNTIEETLKEKTESEQRKYNIHNILFLLEKSDLKVKLYQIIKKLHIHEVESLISIQETKVVIILTCLDNKRRKNRVFLFLEKGFININNSINIKISNKTKRGNFCQSPS
jgi:hypothetical protein